MKIYNQLVLLSILCMMSMTTAIKNPYHVLTNRLFSGKSEEPKPLLGESLGEAYKKLVAERMQIFENLGKTDQTIEIENMLIELNRINNKEKQLVELTMLLNEEGQNNKEKKLSNERNALLQRLQNAFRVSGYIPPNILREVLGKSNDLNKEYESSIEEMSESALQSMKKEIEEKQHLHAYNWLFFIPSSKYRIILKNTYLKNVKERMHILDKLNPSNEERLSQDEIDYNLQELKNLDIQENIIYTSLQKYLIPTSIRTYFNQRISKIKKYREILLNTFAELIKNQTNIEEYNEYLKISESLNNALKDVVNVCMYGIDGSKRYEPNNPF